MFLNQKIHGINCLCSAEINEMFHRVMNGIHMKNRLWWCILEDQPKSECGFGLPFRIQALGRRVCAINKHVTREFYNIAQDRDQTVPILWRNLVSGINV